MKRRLASEKISPSAGFEPETPWSDFESAKSSAMRTVLMRSRKQEDVTLTTMPIIWIGTKTTCPFPICGLADGWGSGYNESVMFASLIILYRIGDINDIKTTKTLSKISSLLWWIMHQSFVIPRTPPFPHPRPYTHTHTHTHTHKRRIAGTTAFLFSHHSPGTCWEA